MCICILIQHDGKITEDRLSKAAIANPDGWGVMWAKGDELFTAKSSRPNPNLYNEIMELPRPVVVHFRTASSGAIGHKFCHPFRVNINLAFVQNGNFPEFAEGSDGLSDVQRFNERFLKKLPDNWWHGDYYFSVIDSYCKKRLVKMVFLNNRGEYWIVNEQAGMWRDGCWYSNGGIDDYIGYGYSGAYPYHHGERRHFGGLGSIQMFSEVERGKWRQCLECYGWFPKEELHGLRCAACQEWKEMMDIVA